MGKLRYKRILQMVICLAKPKLLQMAQISKFIHWMESPAGLLID
jgi:hypothetical protein